MLAGTYTLGESNVYDFGYNDTPIKTDPTGNASLSSTYTTAASGSHSFEHEETGGSFSNGSGTGSNWEGQPAAGGPTVASDFINVENESYGAADGGSGSYGNGSTKGADGGGNTENSRFGYNRNHFEAGNYQLLSGGGTSTNVSFSDDQQQTYDATDTETENFHIGTEGGEINGTLNSTDHVHDTIDDQESGGWSNGSGGYQANIPSFDDTESDSESFHLSETGSDTENVDGIAFTGSFSFDETDHADSNDEEDGSYNVAGVSFSIPNGLFDDTAHADDSYNYSDSGNYQGTQNDDGDNITLSGSYSDSDSGNDNADETDDGSYNVADQTTTDNGEDTLDESAGLSYSSSGSDNAHDPSVTVGDTYSDTGGGGGTFSESGTFSDDSTGETADGTDDDQVSASDSATGTVTAHGGDASSTFTASDSASNSSSFTYHDDGNYDIAPSEDDFTGDEGETDVATSGDTWSESGSISGSNPFTFSEGGGDQASANYVESDHYTDDEAGVNTSDEEDGTISDNDGGTASATYSDSGTTTNATSTVHYTDSQSESDTNSFTDSDNFDDAQSSSGESDSESESFSASDDSDFGAKSDAWGNYTDPSDSGAFTHDANSQSEHIERDNGDDDIETGKSESGTTNFSVSDILHSMFGDSDGGHFTNGHTGDYDDGDGEDDTETSSRSGSTVTNSTGTVTSGTFGDDSRKIDGDYADESEQQGSDSDSGGKLDFESSSYHDGGNFTDSSLSESRSATFTAKHENVAADGFSESNTASHSNDGGDEANVENDSADGSYTKASGTLTVTFNGTADDIDGADYHDSDASISNGPSSSGSTSLSYSVSLGTHSHLSGDQTQVNGAVTAADQDYTLDGIIKLAVSRLENNQASGSGENTSTSSSASDSKSGSSHDSGTHDVSGGATSDTGSKREVDNDVQTASDTIATSFNNQAGVGSSIQTDSYSDANDYFDSGSYTNSGGSDTESDNFDGHDAASQSTNYTLTAQAAGDPGTSWTSTFTDNSSSNHADRGNEDLSNGSVTDETDNFHDVNSEHQHASFDKTSDRSGAVVPDGFASPQADFPALVENELPLWPGAPEFDSGNFTPPEYAGGDSVATISTADSTTDYDEMDVESGVQTDVSGSTNTDETFYDTDTISDSSDETETSGAGTSGISDFVQYVLDDKFDTETDVNYGTVDGGVTTDHYNDTGEEIDEHSSSYSFDATADVGGEYFETGHGLDEIYDKQTILLAETGDYTTSPSTIESTADNPNGDATFDQSIAFSDGLVEWEHDSLTGTKEGNGISVSGSGDYAGNATDNVISDDTVDVDVAGGTDSQGGDYSSDVSVLADVGFSETGTQVFTDDGGGVDTLAVNYTHEHDSSRDDTDIGNYGSSSGGGGTGGYSGYGASGGGSSGSGGSGGSGTAGGTDEIKTTDIDTTDEKFVETLADGQSFTSDTPTGINQTSDSSTPDGGKQAPADGGVQKPPPGASLADMQQKAEEAGMSLEEFLALVDGESANMRANLEKPVEKSDAEKRLENIQTGLDAAGMVPVVGEVFDGANALVSLAMGDYTGAALSAGSMVPIAGWAGGGAKLARRRAKIAGHADEARGVAKVVASNAGEARALVRSESKALGGGLDATKKLPSGGPCFTAGTLVLTPDIEDSSRFVTRSVSTIGTCAIESITLGSRVIGENPRPWDTDSDFPEPDSASWLCVTARVQRSDGAVVEMEFLRPRKVIEASGISAGRRLLIYIPEIEVRGEVTIDSISEAPRILIGEGHVVTGRFVTRKILNLVHLALSDGSNIEVTDVHPIWSVDREDWIPAGQLRPGETLDGMSGAVHVNRVTVVGFAPAVYNIEVHSQHVYRVAGAGILVHNADPIACAEQGVGAASNLGQVATKAEIDSNKFKYVFGEVASNEHNAARSLENVAQMNRIGIGNTPQGRQILTEALEKAAKDPSNIKKTFTKKIGNTVQSFEVRESLLAGPGGFVKVESTWEVLADGTRRLTTIIPFGG